MLKLARLLHHRGSHITFANTEFNQTRFLRSGACSEFSDPNFRFETIPDALPPSYPGSTQDHFALLHSIRHNFLGPFCDLVAKLNDASSSSNVPPVSCILSDVCLPFTVKAAQNLGGIPLVMFVPIPAFSFMVYKQFPALRENGLLPPKEESLIKDGFLDSVIDQYPGMDGMRMRHLRPMLRKVLPMDWLIDLMVEMSDGSTKADAIIIHTFDALEQQVLNALACIVPSVYSVGPLQLLLNQETQQEEKDKCLNSTGYSLWKEENECLQWLDSKRPGSVIYVSFGSSTSIKNNI